MKARISFLDSVALELQFERQEGRLAIRGLFPKFLARPYDPHVSIFAEPRGGFFTPHFTAETDPPFRRTLAKVTPRALAAGLMTIENAALRSFADGLERVDLRALEAEGWMMHWLDLRAVRRWARRASGDFIVNEKTITSLVEHLFRHRLAPAQLADSSPDRPLRFVLMRFDTKDVLHMRTLFFMPDGFGIPSAENGEPMPVREPGWYVPRDGSFDGLVDVLPIDRTRTICTRVAEWLQRYPRRQRPESLPWVKDLGGCIGYVAGVYGSDLLEAVLLAREYRVSLAQTAGLTAPSRAPSAAPSRDPGR